MFMEYPPSTGKTLGCALVAGSLVPTLFKYHQERPSEPFGYTLTARTINSFASRGCHGKVSRRPRQPWQLENVGKRAGVGICRAPPKIYDHFVSWVRFVLRLHHKIVSRIWPQRTTFSILNCYLWLPKTRKAQTKIYRGQLPRLQNLRENTPRRCENQNSKPGVVEKGAPKWLWGTG